MVSWTESLDTASRKSYTGFMSKKEFDFRLFGVAKVGEKGQIVIPAVAREKLGLKFGDEVIMFGSARKKFVGAMREEDFRVFLEKIGKKIDFAAQAFRENFQCCDDDSKIKLGKK